MGRAGILYYDVVKAANQLAEAGKTPTVEGVREALGGTGSNSTIAPYLKRWKEEHRQSVTEAQTGLPTVLVDAVRQLHEHLQAEAATQLETAREQHQAALAQGATREQALKTSLAGTQDQLQVANEQLTALNAALARLQAEHQSQSLALATAQAEKEGLEARLADKAQELVETKSQLRNALAQVEHIQQDAKERREAAGRQIEALMLELRTGHARVAEQQATLQHQQRQLERQEAGQEAARKELRTLAQAHDALRSERDRSLHQLDLVTSDRDRLTDTHRQIQAALQQASSALAAKEEQANMLRETLQQATGRLTVLDAERTSWLQERGAMQARIEQLTAAANPVATPPATH